MAQKEQWGTRIGVILAVAGSAVGLGNFLRFPGQAAQNGGGAFMIPYFISLLLLGIPLCWAEWTMGRFAGTRGFHSAPGIFIVLCRNTFARYFGTLALLVPLVIYMYYVVIEAWCLSYAISYLDGSLMPAANPGAYDEYFGSLVGIGQDGALFRPGHRDFLGILIFTFVMNFFFIYRGITKGIEAFCRVAMPIMVVLALVVLVRVLTLGTPDPAAPDRNVVNGLGSMWNPNFAKLSDPNTWLAASGQIFFSLSVGFGVIINYSSYMRKNDDVALSGLTATSMNEFFEVCLGGLITLPAAFIFLGAAAQEMGTFGLGFTALPSVFAVMPAGQLFGFLWFIMLFIAAITSSLSMLQPVIAFFEEGLGLKRHAAAAILGLIAAIGSGFVVYFSKDLKALDTMDFWVGTMCIFVLAMFQAAVYSIAFSVQSGHAALHEGSHIRVPIALQYLLKFVTPVYLLLIFVAFCIFNVPDYFSAIGKSEVALASIMFISIVGAFLLVMVHIAGIRWMREGKLNFLFEEAGEDEQAANDSPAV